MVQRYPRPPDSYLFVRVSLAARGRRKRYRSKEGEVAITSRKAAVVLTMLSPWAKEAAALKTSSVDEAVYYDSSVENPPHHGP